MERMVTLRRFGVGLAGGLLAIGLLAGCNNVEGSTSAADTPTVTTVGLNDQPTTTIKTYRIEVTSGDAVPTQPVSSEVAVVVTTPQTDGIMPDVLCMDLQAAQNLIQDRGVFYSKSEDASGKGRRQIRDSNWIVVEQTPAAGEPIGEGDAVLSVLKDDEVETCAG